jgi:hypothetical protein
MEPTMKPLLPIPTLPPAPDGNRLGEVLVLFRMASQAWE